MDSEGLKELFEPFAPVNVKRMFSGYGVYARGICFALNLRGDIFLKADPLTTARFAEAGSEPFVYEGKRGKVTVTSYWRLVSSAYDDPEELKGWCALAFEAATRAAAAKLAKNARKIAKKETSRGHVKSLGSGGAAKSRKVTKKALSEDEVREE
jgi:DNA transformation protein and related proteins